MTIKTVIVDNGKENFKWRIDGCNNSFPSKLEEGVPVYNEDEIIYNNKSYIIGEEAEDYNYEFTKNNFHHKLLLYYCLAKNTEDVQSFNLVIGCPLTTYLNKNEHESYIESIRNNGQPIQILLNRKKKIIIIKNITIVPESIGGYILDYNKSKLENRGVIDIGGLNMNGAIYSMGKPIKDKMITTNMGMHILMKNIQQAVLREREETINLYTCKYLMSTKNFNGDAKLKEIFDKECIKFITNIKKSLTKNDWELKQLNLRFIGGGSIQLKQYIKEVFGDVYIEDNLFANCEAFEIFAKIKNGKK